MLTKFFSKFIVAISAISIFVQAQQATGGGARHTLKRIFS